MKVLHVIPSVAPDSGGPAQAIIPMCRQLKSQGVDVLLVTTDAGITTNSPIKDRVVDYKGVSTVFFKSQLGESFKFSRPMSVWLDRNITKFDLVHVHAIFNHASIAATRACQNQHVPYVIRPLGSLDPWSMSQKRFRKQLFWRLSGQKMMHGAAAVHYTTNAERDSVEQTLRLNHGHVIPLGIEFEPTDFPAQANGLKNLLSGLDHHPYVLVLSRLHPKKALDVLIEAFAHVTSNDQFAEWRLVIAGEGPSDYMERLRGVVSNENAEARIIFPGWLDGDNKRSALRNASLLALASYQENFGLCVIEALSYSVPVLISPQVNLADEIKNAGAGWISNVDRKALEAALSDIFQNGSERATRGSAGKVLSQQFTWDRAATQLIRMYSSITTSRGH